MDYLPFNQGSMTNGISRTIFVVSFLAFVVISKCVLCAFPGGSCDHSVMSSPASSSSDSHVYCVAKECRNRVRPPSEAKCFRHQLCRVHFKCTPKITCPLCEDFTDTDWNNLWAYFDRLERRANNNRDLRRRQKQAKEKASNENSVRCSPVSDPTSSSASTLASASVANKGTKTGGEKVPPSSLISAAKLQQTFSQALLTGDLYVGPTIPKKSRTSTISAPAPAPAPKSNRGTSQTSKPQTANQSMSVVSAPASQGLFSSLGNMTGSSSQGQENPALQKRPYKRPRPRPRKRPRPRNARLRPR